MVQFAEILSVTSSEAEISTIRIVLQIAFSPSTNTDFLHGSWKGRK